MEDEFYLKDIKSLKELLDGAEDLEKLRKVIPPSHSLWDHLEGDPKGAIKEMKRLANLPDRFNDHFADEGWIIYEKMDADVAEQAVELAEDGNLEEAEEVLVDCYDEETINFQLNQMSRIDAFKSRLDLAQKALDDYLAERYHACIPITLFLLDGLVQEIDGEHSFYSDGSEIKAWDSISAHSKGLEKLKDIMMTGRKKTNTDEITIPYRNGILHGTDLNYDNKTVAAKSWNALFAIQDWAYKAEQGKLNPHETEEEDVSIKEVLDEYEELQEEKDKLNQWQPRKVEVGEDIPETPLLEDLEEGTPERRALEFLTYWKDDNYGYMAKFIPPSEGIEDGKAPQEIREFYRNHDLKDFSLQGIFDKAAVITVVKAKVKMVQLGKEVTKKIDLRMIRQDEDGNSPFRNDPNGEWYIGNWSTLGS